MHDSMEDAVAAFDRDPESGAFQRLTVCLGILAALLLAWWLLAALLVPPIIRLAHSGAELPLLSDLMGGRDSTPVDRYLERWAAIRRGGMEWATLIGCMLLPIAVGSSPVAAALSRIGRPLRPTWWTSGLLLAVVLAAICVSVPLLVYIDPVAYVYAITDDYWVEYGTFVSFIVGGTLSWRAALAQSGLRRTGLVLFAIAALFVGLEEISWGQRIIGFGTPDALIPYNEQGEVNFHNIWSPTRRAVGLALVAFTVVLPQLRRRSGQIDRWITRVGLPVPPVFLWPPFMFATILLVFPLDYAFYTKMDEVAELGLGLVVLLLSVYSILRASGDKEIADHAVGPATICCIAWVAIVTGALVSIAPNPQGLSVRLNDFAAERFPDGGRPDAAFVVFEYLEGREEYRTERTRIEYARLLRAHGRDARADEVLRSALRELDAAPRAVEGDSIERRRKRAEIRALLDGT